MRRHGGTALRQYIVVIPLTSTCKTGMATASSANNYGACLAKGLCLPLSVLQGSPFGIQEGWDHPVEDVEAMLEIRSAVIPYWTAP